MSTFASRQNLVSHVGSSISAASMAAQDATETVLDTSRTAVAGGGPAVASAGDVLKVGDWAIDLSRSGSGRGAYLGVELEGSALPFGFGVSGETSSEGPGGVELAGATATSAGERKVGQVGQLAARIQVSGDDGQVVPSSSAGGPSHGGPSAPDDASGAESAPLPTVVGVEVLETVEHTIETWIRSLAGGQVPAGVEVVPGGGVPGMPVGGERLTFGLRGPLLGGASAFGGARGPDLLVSLVWKGSWSAGVHGSGDYWRVDEVPSEPAGPVAESGRRPEPGTRGPSGDGTRAE